MPEPNVEAVEIKVAASEHGERAVQRKLHLRDGDAEHRDVYFFDTRELRLFDQGLVLRARRIHDGADDFTVKIRPFAEDAEDRWTGDEPLEIELDVVGSTAVRSAKLEARQKRGEIGEVAAGRRPVRTLISAAQERLVAAFQPGDVPWEALLPLGPIRVHRWVVTTDALDARVIVEEWMLPSTDDVVELSIKVDPAGWRRAQQRFAAFLGDHGIEVDPDQQAKTRWALDVFARGA
jgi:hypothetical protein